MLASFLMINRLHTNILKTFDIWCQVTLLEVVQFMLQPVQLMRWPILIYCLHEGYPFHNFEGLIVKIFHYFNLIFFLDYWWDRIFCTMFIASLYLFFWVVYLITLPVFLWGGLSLFSCWFVEVCYRLKILTFCMSCFTSIYPFYHLHAIFNASFLSCMNFTLSYSQN